MTTFAEILRDHAGERPQAAALSFEGTTWTFRELHERSSCVANALQASGVRAGDRVAVLTKNRAENYELIYACSQIGAILVGLNWRLAALEIAAIVEDAKPSVIIVSEEGKNFGLRNDGSLRDISPTILSMLGLPLPHEMTGRDMRVKL